MNLLLAVVVAAATPYLLFELYRFWLSIEKRAEQLRSGEVVLRPGLEWDGTQYVVVPPWYPPA